MPQRLTLTSLPLFPLKTVLFPGGHLALQVFEVRYLDMVRKCQSTGAPFGVVALQSGHEVRRAGAAQEQLNAIGTLAAIEHLQTPQPGLITLRCTGSQRFRIEESTQLPTGLWVANVECLADDLDVPVPQELQAIALALAKVLTRLSESQNDPGAPPPCADQLQNSGWVANRWCELLPVPSPLKQRLMELDNPLIRLELVGDILERMDIAH